MGHCRISLACTVIHFCVSLGTLYFACTVHCFLFCIFVFLAFAWPASLCIRISHGSSLPRHDSFLFSLWRGSDLSSWTAPVPRLDLRPPLKRNKRSMVQTDKGALRSRRRQGGANQHPCQSSGDMPMTTGC